VGDDLQVFAVQDLLLRSIANLIRNAIRYAGLAGPITISAERIGDTVVIKVADCGPGVPDDALAQLFDPFYRPEAARTRETGGVGLGLAIVKTCVESCGGTVSCRNCKPGFEVSVTLKGA